MRTRRETRADALDTLLDEAPWPLAVVDGALRVTRMTSAFAALLHAAAGAVPVAIPPSARASLRSAIADGRGLRVPFTTDGLATSTLELVLVPMGARTALLWADTTKADAESRAAERLQAIGRLTGGIAHDFNNLLLAILASAEALAVEMGGVPEDLAQIRASAERGALLVRQLLAAGEQQVLVPEPVNVNEAVRTMAGIVRRLLEPAITLRLDLEEPPRSVRVDRSQLDQVLLNLVMNARAAMSAGGTLTLSTRPAILLDPEPDGPEVIPPGRYAVIEVADTGPGIVPELVARMFEPFVSGTGGTGLGLATVRGIVHQSGGAIGVRSAPGEGAAFRIYLPRDESALPRDEQTTAASRGVPAAAPAAPRILLVEDETPVRRLATRALELAGYEVAAVASGDEGLELLDGGFRPGLLVTDLSMPGMDGATLLAASRRRIPALPAIVISGFAETAIRSDLAQAGEVRFLAKPFDMKRLVEAVQAEVTHDEG